MNQLLRNHILGISLSLFGLFIAALAFLDPILLLDTGNYDWSRSYMKLMLLPLGVLSIGLAIVAIAINLIHRNFLFGITASILATVSLGCFAVGTFYVYALVGFVVFVAVMLEMAKMEFEM